jgi:hypothetical protein
MEVIALRVLSFVTLLLVELVQVGYLALVFSFSFFAFFYYPPTFLFILHIVLGVFCGAYHLTHCTLDVALLL